MRGVISRLGNRLLTYFLAGLLAILPIVITVGTVVWVAEFLRSFVGPHTTVGKLLMRVGGLWGIEGLPETVTYVLGWIIVLGAVFTLGLVIESGAKRLIQQLADHLFHRIPLIGSVYKTSKQVVQMLETKEEEAMQGMSVVFCYFGDPPAHNVLALLVSPQRFQVDGEEYQIVVIPTAPVPFGGALLFVPARHIRPAHMPVDGLMSIYLSMGVSAPEYIKP